MNMNRNRINSNLLIINKIQNKKNHNNNRQIKLISNKKIIIIIQILNKIVLKFIVKWQWKITVV